MGADAQPGQPAAPFYPPGKMQWQLYDFHRLPDDKPPGSETPASRYIHCHAMTHDKVGNIHHIGMDGNTGNRLRTLQPNSGVQMQVNGRRLYAVAIGAEIAKFKLSGGDSFSDFSV